MDYGGYRSPFSLREISGSSQNHPTKTSCTKVNQHWMEPLMADCTRAMEFQSVCMVLVRTGDGEGKGQQLTLAARKSACHTRLYLTKVDMSIFVFRL